MLLSSMSASQPYTFSLWNANGLRLTTIQDSLSYVLSSHIFFITETWLTPPMLIPTDWPQFHLYGTKVAKANRGMGGVAALVNPSCPYQVTLLPSPNAYTLSLKVGVFRVHCVYLPPSLKNAQFLDVLESIPLVPNTIICGDFNARLGESLGDYAVNPRGRLFEPWVLDRQLSILNASLALGIPTFNGFRLGEETSSVIDLFVTNIDASSMYGSFLHVESELSLGSDHRLLTLSFDYDTRDIGSGANGAGAGVSVRRLWNLTRLGKEKYLTKYRSTFKSQVRSLNDSLSALVDEPPEVMPDIDSLYGELMEGVYSSLDASVGNKPARPSYWKKYWTQELQDAAEAREVCYRRWRRAITADKMSLYLLYQAANRLFRKAVQAAKRASWKQFVASLETDFSKATSAIKNIKRRHGSSSSFAHPDGPATSATVMATHLASIYDGSLLPSISARPAPPDVQSDGLPHELPLSSLFDQDSISIYLNQLPRRKAPGPDHIKAEMLRPLSDILVPVLENLFLLCWQWSYTPLVWRQATVFPIFKKGDASDPANYRPISLTSVMRKLFEMVLSQEVKDSSPPLDIAQGGFRENRGPLDQALCLHDLMHDYYLTHHHYPCVAFLDIKSAYDTVDRRVVWRSLQDTAKMPAPLLGLLMNMFDEVQVSVLISNHSSAPFSISTGLLQGSVLSPHLYSVYINSLPTVLRQAASPTTTLVHIPDVDAPAAMNSLLFADDVAIFGSKQEVQAMLDLAAEHSMTLGYRWSPSKCMVLNAPSPTSSSSLGFEFKLYGVALPRVDEFSYLGVPFRKKGLCGGAILDNRLAGAIKTMALLTSIGVHRNGFSLLLCAKLYKIFIRPKLEYGLAISRLTAPEIKKLDRAQDKLVGMFLGSNHTAVAKHITCIPLMSHRYDILVTRYVLRAEFLPEDSLVLLLNDNLSYTRLDAGLKSNKLFLSLPDPVPDSQILLKNIFRDYYQDHFDKNMAQCVISGKKVLLRACCPCTSKPDPVLFLPMTTVARSRLVRWRLGRFTAMSREECPCQDFGALISRDHFLTCRAIDPSLFDSLPRSPPGVNRIDFALSSLPTKSKKGPPAFWSALLTILWLIDTLCHPSKNIPEDPSPGSSWLPPAQVEKSE